MIKRVFFLLFFNTMICSFFLACVGTVEDADTDTRSLTDASGAKGTNYEGIIDAYAVAHNRFEVIFEALPDELYEHYLFVNQSTVPLRIDLTDPDLVSLGGERYLFTYVQGDLSNNFNFLGFEHTFKVRAKRKEDNVWTEKENEVQAKGFLNRVSFFDGISSIEAFPGALDRKAIIKWSPYPMEGTFVATESDAVYYVVTYIEASEGYQNLYNPNYAGSKRFTQREPAVARATPLAVPSEVTISGLKEDTEYFFSVRAVHKKYADELDTGNTNIPFLPEQNNRFLRHRTGSSTGVFDLSANALTLKGAAAAAGLNSALASWEEAVGTFHSYRLYYREYTGISDPNADDKLDLVTDLIPLGSTCDTSGAIKCAEFSPTVTSATISSLVSYSHYQFKLVLCYSASCTLDPLAVVAPDRAAIVGNLEAIRIEPTLAPFAGIEEILHPTDVSDLDKAEMSVFPAATTVGYADDIEVYCFDPADKTSYVAFPQDGSAIASAISPCNGLSIRLQGGAPLNTLTPGNLASLVDYEIQGIVADGNTEYCFQAIDAINDQGAVNIVKQAVEGDKATCFFPRINTPSVEQFPGALSCSVTHDEITVNWNLPSAGIYNNFKVYWKERGAFSFNFEAAIAASAGYDSHTAPNYLPVASTSYTITSLTPGKTYDIGVLAWATGAIDTPSEYNTNIQTCKVEFPKATFQSWQRIFAIGPKIDGRYNLDSSLSNLYNGYKVNAYIAESLNEHAIPVEYESSTYVTPPGQYNGSPPTTFTEAFDGSFNSSGMAYSTSGIVSLAWQEVDLDYGDTAFQTGQDHGTRSTRTFGYKVLRSFDNGINWEDLTSSSGLIHAGNFTYLPRSNAQATSDEVTTRMAFFTDYSISSLRGDQDIERARIVLYKIAPFYDETELNYEGAEFNKHHIVKVIVPPANMALVNRLISNKTMCEEIGKAYETGNNYVCSFNGLGAKPRGLPWSLGSTVIDQGGDLLVDRFELGCNYTRGDIAQDPELGRSWIDTSTAPYNTGFGGDLSYVSQFLGINTVDSSFMKGCFHEGNRLDSRFESTSFTTPPDEKRVLFGDCIDGSRMEIAYQVPGPFYVPQGYFNAPGVPNSEASDYSSDAASNTDADRPQIAFGADASGSYSFFGNTADFRRNVLTQSEYAAVFYNQTNSVATHIISPRGPNHTDPSGATMMDLVPNNSSHRIHQSCFINLGAIGSDGATRARWFPTSYLDRVSFENGNRVNLNDKTLAEIQAANNFYNSSTGTSEFLPISSSLWDSSRINASMKLPRIFSSNSAKLPPLQGLNQTSFAKVCGTYRLQVGEGDDTTFSPRSAVINKRLLRRADYVAASAYPETTTYNEAAVQDIEEGDSASFTQACASAANPVAENTSTALVKTQLGSKSTSNEVGGVASSFHTGSGVLDVGGDSQNCTSKYGIQDLVGNLVETVADQIHCDYSLDALYFGLYDTIGQFGTPTQSVVLSNTTAQNGIEFWSDAKIYDHLGADITPAVVRPWARIDPNSGYCSVVDNIEANLTNSSFRTGSTFLTLDQLMLDPDFLGNSVDSHAIGTQRNGDGSYTSFGSSALLPELRYVHSLAMSNDGINTADPNVAKGNYFSTLLGLPLMCDISSPSYNPCGPDGIDNKRVTTSYLNTRNTPDLTNTTITNFPTHNSQILSAGIADIGDGPSSPTMWDPSAPTGGVGEVVTEVHLNGPPGANPLAPIGGYSFVSTPLDDTSVFTGGTETYYSIRWTVPRGARLGMDSGGSYGSTTGRYSMSNTVIYNEYSVPRNGARCAVFVNLDELRSGIEQE